MDFGPRGGNVVYASSQDSHFPNQTEDTAAEIGRGVRCLASGPRRWMGVAPTFEEVGGLRAARLQVPCCWAQAVRACLPITYPSLTPAPCSQIGGYGLSAGQTTLLCCVVAWAVVVCCLLERRTVGRSNGLLSLLEEVERLKNEGADLSLDEVAEEEEPAFDPSKLSEEELKMRLETSSRNLDD